MKEPIGYQTAVVGFAIADDGTVHVLRKNGWGVGSQKNYYRLGERRIKSIVGIGEEMVRLGKWGKQKGFGIIYGENYKLQEVRP